MRKIKLPPKTVLGFKKNGQPIYNIAGGSDPIDGGGYDGGDGGQQGTGGDSPGINPSWNEYLANVPQEHHQYVVPAFKAWDESVTKRFETVHQEYEPWKPLKEAGVDADTASFAVRLLNQINDNPQQVWEAIGQYYNLNGSPTGQGQEPQEGQLEPDPYDNRFSELERQNQIMAAHLVKQQEAQLNAQAEAELDSELTSMRQKYKAQGDFDENFVLTHIASGMDTEAAVKRFYEFRDQQLQRYGQKPLIMGPGGGVPSFNNTDVRKMSDGETRNLVAQMLNQANLQNKQ